MSGIPCDHACVAIRRMGFDVSDYVDDWYKYNLQEKYTLEACVLW